MLELSIFVRSIMAINFKKIPRYCTLQAYKKLPQALQYSNKNYPSLTFLKEQNWSRDQIYDNLYQYFDYDLPISIFKHRHYFDQVSKGSYRGCGEDPFHAMWFLLFKEFRPVNCLEVGVYRGQTISLWALLSAYFDYSANISAISPFAPVGDEVSIYEDTLNYLDDTIENHHYFHLPIPEFCRALSTDTQAIELIESKRWDLIYIDGGHDYDVVLHDIQCAIKNLSPNGLIVMDDSSLYFDFSSKSGRFKGHDGPSLVTKEMLEAHKLELVLGVGHNNVLRLASRH